MFERFTAGSRDAVRLASDESRLLRSPFVGAGHLLLGVLRDGHGIGAQTLGAHGVDLDAARALVSELYRPVDGPVPGVSGELLRSIGIDLDEVLRRTEETFGRDAVERAVARTRPLSRRRPRRMRCAPRGAVPFSPRAKRALELALQESLRLGHRYIGTEHILLGVLRDAESAPPRRRDRRSPGDPGMGALLLSAWNVSPAVLRAAVEQRIRRAG